MKNLRGSALVTVIIITGCLILVLGSLLRLSVLERRANYTMAAWLEARLAAEAVVEFAAGQVRSLYLNQGAPDLTDSTIAAKFAMSSAQKSALFSASNVVQSSLEVKVGSPVSIQTSGLSGLYYYNPNDPNNLNNDPAYNTRVTRNDIVIVGKASVTVPGHSESTVTAYLEETISLRGNYPVQYAMFYYTDNLEIAPGPDMHIYGPVHTNKDLYLLSRNSLNFHSTVAAAGLLYHAWGNAALASHGNGESDQILSNFAGSVKFSNSTKTGLGQNLYGVLSGSSSVWIDSTAGTASTSDTTTDTPAQLLAKANASYAADNSIKNRDKFRTYASQTWGSSILTGDMGVQTSLFPGVDTANNNSHVTIEPSGGGTTAQESVKFANKSAIYVKVTLSNPAAGVTPTASYRFYSKVGGVTREVTAPVNTASALLKFKPYTQTDKAVSSTGSGSSKTYTVTTTTTTSAGAAVTGTVAGNSSSTASSTLDNGMVDMRRGLGVDIVELDMDVLKTMVGNMKNNVTNDSSIIDPDTGSVLHNWNGGLYIEVNDTSTRGGTSNQSASLRLVNGDVSSGSSLMPDYNTSPEDPNCLNGLTIATNAPCYVKGHFNADGVLDNTVTSDTYVNKSASMPDDVAAGSATITGSKESPVMIAADSVTLLSPGWNDTLSRGTNYGTASSYSCPDASGAIEVSAALWVGNVSTTTTNGSGGAHNLIRFLENWKSSITVAYRGSLMCMFNSTISTQPFIRSGGYKAKYYGAPVRNWGLNTLFTTGNKRPPLCFQPNTFRRVGFRDLKTSAVYEARKGSI